MHCAKNRVFASYSANPDLILGIPDDLHELATVSK